jgi:hypothetical protein
MSHSEPSRPQRATLVPTEAPLTGDERLDVALRVADRLRMGPLVSGLVGGVLAVLGHHLLTANDTDKRLQNIERHMAWQQAAIVAQSRGEPLPPPTLTFDP